MDDVRPRRALTLCIVALVQCARSERPASEAVGAECPRSSLPTDTGRRLTLERTACLGNCPVYRVVVHSNGRVDWSGDRFVAREGTALSCLPAESVATLWQTVDRWLVTHPNENTETCVTFENTAGGRIYHFGETDQPTLRITVHDTKTSTWVHSFGCSDPATRDLLEIESQVRELVVDLDVWVYGAAP